jgi:hypothetical protein
MVKESPQTPVSWIVQALVMSASEILPHPSSVTPLVADMLSEIEVGTRKPTELSRTARRDARPTEAARQARPGRPAQRR